MNSQVPEVARAEQEQASSEKRKKKHTHCCHVTEQIFDNFDFSANATRIYTIFETAAKQNNQTNDCRVEFCESSVSMAAETAFSDKAIPRI